MNRQIHHWLVVDFESNERDPRTTPLRTEYDGLTIHIQPRMDEYCDVMSTVECSRQLDTNSAYNKRGTIADWQSGFTEPSHEEALLRMQPGEVGHNRRSEGDCL